MGADTFSQYADGPDPLREVRAGTGYWSSDGLVQVLGVRTGMRPTAVWVRWPGGAVQTLVLHEGVRGEVVVKQP